MVLLPMSWGDDDVIGDARRKPCGVPLVLPDRFISESARRYGELEDSGRKANPGEFATPLSGKPDSGNIGFKSARPERPMRGSARELFSRGARGGLSGADHALPLAAVRRPEWVS